jgi:uncharacterized protein (TIGR01777 family)
MKILVSGSHGLVGSALIPELKKKGHQVAPLVRQTPRDGEVFWNPEEGKLDAAALAGFDAVIHLAGEGIASKRWTAGQKARILDSRVRGTTLLAETLAGLPAPPKMFLSASAIGYYGNRGGEALTEESPPGSDFLANVCQAWEGATQPAVRKGIRVVLLRTGIVLSPAGGALAKMLPPFKMGVGGNLGNGKQFMSWISLDDEIGAILHALETNPLRGPVNLVCPKAVTNAAFTKAMGRALKRPTLLPMPAFAARLAFGEMADALLLSSARVEPKRLLTSNYRFRFPDLDEALKHLLHKN